jgi:integrase
LAREFLYRLADRHASWSWTATHITALRTVFDKLGGAALTEGIPTPKRPRRLHDVLDPAEVTHLLKAAGSTRDRLAILLLYGCGLKTSELCALRWSDVDLDGRTLRVQCAGGTPCSMRCASLQGTREREPRGAERSTRQVFLPENAIPLLQAESCLRDASDPVFPGVSGRSPTKPDLFGRSTTQPETQSGRPFCARTLQRIVRHAAAKAGLTKEVCCRTLRRSYAVQCLRDGMNVRQLQESLGHQHVETTLQYCRYLPPKAANNSDALFCEFRLQPLEPSPFAPALAAIQCSAP